ncbi:MAG: hypothetical protein F6K11_31840, partial [Leptolyngbya sp. SIO3F4]|nr:hypothetical protein [Leptolyngbya sp. SIO3F4]
LIDSEGRGIQIFPLRVARAEELARTIDQMYPEPPMPVDSRGRPRPDLRQGKEIFVRADVATNSLIVDAPSARLAGFEQLVKELDRAKATEDVEVRTYQLKRADLESVQRTLRELADRNALGATGRTPVTISAELRGQSLIVSGPVEIFQAVEDLIASLDSPPDLPTRVLRFYRLEHAKADNLAPVLRETLQDQAAQLLGPEHGSSEDVLSVSSDAGSNTLIISAPESVQQVASELVQALDSQAAAGSQHNVRVISLTYADANSVAPTLSAAAAAMDIPQAAQPMIRAVRGVNSIVVSGSKKEVEQIAELVTSLDVRPIDAESPGVETFELQHAQAEVIAETIESLLVNQLETDPRVMAIRLRYTRDQAPPAPSVKVEPDGRTNTLIVSAPVATLELARTIVQKLDQPSGGERSMVTFTPARSKADTLADAVRRVIENTAVTQRDAAELYVEPTTGSIVVTGTQDAVAQAASLLAEYDERTVAIPETTIRTIRLRSVSAESLARTLTSVLSDRTRWPEKLIQAADAGLPIASPSFSANQENNSILVVVPSTLDDLVDQLVSSFDDDTSGDRDTRVFRITRGDASSIAGALSTSLTESAYSADPEVPLPPNL